MKKKLLVATPYSGYIHVTPELWLQLQDCDVYTKGGGWSEPTYSLGEQELETIVLTMEELVNNQEVIDIKNISAENNRLTRLVAQLQTELDKLNSTKVTSSEVVLI